MIIANIIALILVLLGALNWGLVGIFAFNLVTWVTFGVGGIAIAIYVIIMLAAIWLIVSCILSHGMIDVGCRYRKNAERK